MKELRDSLEFGFIDVHGEVLENIVGAETRGVFFAAGVFEEGLNTLLEFFVLAAEFFVDKGDDLIIVLYS